MSCSAPSWRCCDLFSLLLSSLLSVIISAAACGIIYFAIPPDVHFYHTLPRHWFAFICACIIAIASALFCQRQNSIGRKLGQKLLVGRFSSRCASATLVSLSFILLGISLALPFLFSTLTKPTSKGAFLVIDNRVLNGPLGRSRCSLC